MRLPTEREQQQLRDNNRRIAEAIAKATPAMAAMVQAWKVFARQMAASASASNKERKVSDPV